MYNNTLNAKKKICKTRVALYIVVYCFRYTASAKYVVSDNESCCHNNNNFVYNVEFGENKNKRPSPDLPNMYVLYYEMYIG